jgi:3'(2'), 5'-bisphosphate nucleotidase
VDGQPGRSAPPSPPAATAREHADAAGIAGAAGRLLVELRNEPPSGVSGKQLGALADAGSHELILAMLGERYPQDPVLSEEAADDPARLDSRRVWIVDPLDGTREFGEVPRTDWAVHVALIVDGRPAAGAVALPAESIVLGTGQGLRLAERLPGPLRLVVSRTRPPELSQRVADALGGELVAMGSAGAKTMAVVRGHVDVYLHGGGQYEWDSAAPVAVALEAGAHASRLDGTELAYNRPEPWLPDLVICRPDLAERVLAEVARLS